MKLPKSILFKRIENKTITWFENNNEYLILENTVADIIQKISQGVSENIIAATVSEEQSVPLEAARAFVLDIKLKIYEPNMCSLITPKKVAKASSIPVDFEFKKQYQVNNLVFSVFYQSEYEMILVHPKFAHLEIPFSADFQHIFQVYTEHKFTFLAVDSKTIGSWNYDNIHFFQGKFSMEFIQKIHQKEEKEWLGVFHASAVSNGEKAMLFLGNSGNGKSTSLGLLQANDFLCLADDFVPMDAKKQEIYSFPAAISIKKSSLPVLLPMYPELETSAEFYFKRLNKIVRYLKPNNSDFFAHQACDDLVFIKYQKDADLSCDKISSLNAFEQLIPDSWFSPIKENIAVFLDWFEKLNCYQLTYSNNEKMIAIVHKIFNDEL